MGKQPSSETSKTAWQRADALQDHEIEVSDIPELRPEAFAKAVVRDGLAPGAEGLEHPPATPV